MARGAAKQRTKSKAPVTPARRPGTSPRPRPTPGANDMTMFFPRLRKQAKWVFVFLAVIFMLSFVFLGVGSGSSGVADLLNPSQWFNSGGSGTSLGSLKKKAEDHPLNARSQLDYAQALQTKGHEAQAIALLEAYLKKRPKDVDVLNDLSARYVTKGQNEYLKAQNAQIEAQSVSGQALVPSLSDKKGNPALGTDPIVDAVNTKAQDTATKAQTATTEAFSNAERLLKTLVAVSHDDTTQIFRLAEVASAANDTQGAITNYKLFIKKAPDDPQVALAKQRIKQLQTPVTSPTVSVPSGG